MSFLLPISSISTGKERRHKQTNGNAGAVTVTGGKTSPACSPARKERKLLKVNVFISNGNAVTLMFLAVLQRFYSVLHPLPATLGHSWPISSRDCFASLGCSLRCRQQESVYFCQGASLTQAE